MRIFLDSSPWRIRSRGLEGRWWRFWASCCKSIITYALGTDTPFFVALKLTGLVSLASRTLPYLSSDAARRIPETECQRRSTLSSRRHTPTDSLSISSLPCRGNIPSNSIMPPNSPFSPCQFNHPQLPLLSQSKGLRVRLRLRQDQNAMRRLRGCAI